MSRSVYMSAMTRLVVGAACLLCGGCGSLYLHDDAAQQATANARSALDKVDVAAVFDNQAAYLDDLQKREFAALADSLGARRDDALLAALEGRKGVDGRLGLKVLVDGYLVGLVCTSDRGNPLRFSTTVANAYMDVSNSKTLADSLTEQWTKDRPRMPRCADTPGINSPSGVTLSDAIAAVQDSTKGLQAKQDEASQGKAAFEESLKQAQAALESGKATQATFAELFKPFNEALQQAENTLNPYLTQALAKSLSQSIDPVIAVTEPRELGKDPGDSRVKAALGLIYVGFGVGDAFSKPPRVPHPNALAATKAWLDYVLARADAQLIKVQGEHAALEAQLDAVAQQVYYLSLAGEALDDPAVAKPSLKSGEGLEKLLMDKDPAPRRMAAAALYDYAAAWSKGFIPAKQLQEVSLPLLERRAKLQQSRLASDAWLGTLKPAVATLAAYGAGGIDPHVVAEFLQVLGITAVAVGVN